MTSRPPKYHEIKETIKQGILSGQWSEGVTIYSEREICEKFGVSRTTAIRVLNELQKENFVRREKGRGNILISSDEKKVTNTVCLMLRTERHFYAPFLHQLLRYFELTHYQLLIFPFGPFSEKKTLQKKWEMVLKARPGAYVINAQKEAPLFLLDNEVKNTASIIFTLNYEHAEKIPAAYVLTDYEKGGLMTANYADSCGYENILCYTNPLDKSNTGQTARIDAIRSFCKRRRKSFAILEREKNLQYDYNPEMIADTLEKIGKNVAVLCDYDARCEVFLNAARKHGWRVPEDLGVIGYFNTPTSQAYGITSVDVHSDEIARTTVEVLQKGTNNTVLIAPSIVERSTTRRRT